MSKQRRMNRVERIALAALGRLLPLAGGGHITDLDVSSLEVSFVISSGEGKSSLDAVIYDVFGNRVTFKADLQV